MTGSYIGKAKGGKLLRLGLSWQGTTVEALQIRGDFFAHPEEGFDKLERSLQGIPLRDVRLLYERGLVAYGVTVYGILPEDLEDALNDILSRSKGAST